MKPETAALLAEIEEDMRRTIDTRDRLHRRAETLRKAASALRWGDAPALVQLQLKGRGIQIGEGVTA